MPDRRKDGRAITPDQLAAAKEQLNLSMPKLAAELGVSERVLYKWMAGTNRIPLMAERLTAHLLRNQKLSAKSAKG